MSQLNVYPRRLLWLGALFVIVALALVAPLSAATFSRRVRAVHTRSQLGRSVQTSRLGIPGDAAESGVEAVCSGALLRTTADQDAASEDHASFAISSRLAGMEFAAFAHLAVAFLVPVPTQFPPCVSPRGPPNS